MDDEEEVLRLILPLSRVREGGVVTKRTGEKQYTVSREVKIYGGPDNTQRIKPEPGVAFLMDGSSHINVLAETTDVVWHVPVWELQEFLNPYKDQ